MDFIQNIPTLLLLVPLLGTFLIGLLPAAQARPAAIILSVLMVVLAVALGSSFQCDQTAMQFEYKANWITNPFPVQFHVGVDGMSLALVILTAFITLMAVLASKNIGATRSKLYYSMVMLLTSSIMGVFVSQDLLQFFLLYELELVPMYFLIAIWGGPNRDYAAMKFLLYTFFGGIFMMAGLLYMYYNLTIAGGGMPTFDMALLAKAAPMLPRDVQGLAFLGFFLAFIIKLPSFPFHTWLPDAHVEAPTPISMILAGLLLKMGSYGLVRICLGYFPDIIGTFGTVILALGCFNIVWGAIACLVQEDMKRIIAYSSVSHMGFILVGMSCMSAAALNGCIFQMISHGVISAALFFLVGVVYDRTHTRNLREIGGGLAKQMPTAFYFWLLACMANLGLPALAGFVAEVTVFYGAFTSPLAVSHADVRPWLIFAGLGVILSAGYMLWLVKRLFYGPEVPKWAGHLSDMTSNEKLVAYSLSFFIIAMGVYPLWVTNSYQVVSDKMTKDALARTSISMKPGASSL